MGLDILILSVQFFIVFISAVAGANLIIIFVLGIFIPIVDYAHRESDFIFDDKRPTPRFNDLIKNWPKPCRVLIYLGYPGIKVSILFRGVALRGLKNITRLTQPFIDHYLN